MPDTFAALCGAQLEDWTCVMPAGRHSRWRHVDAQGNWWSQSRCPNDCGEPAAAHRPDDCPHRLAAAPTTPAPKEK